MCIRDRYITSEYDHAIAFSLNIKTEYRDGGTSEQHQARKAFTKSPHDCDSFCCALALISVVKERAKVVPLFDYCFDSMGYRSREMDP